MLAPHYEQAAFALPPVVLVAFVCFLAPGWAVPPLAVLGIYTFVGYCNGFLWPLLVLSSAEKLTIQVGLSTLRFRHTIDYGLWI